MAKITSRHGSYVAHVQWHVNKGKAPIRPCIFCNGAVFESTYNHKKYMAGYNISAAAKALRPGYMRKYRAAKAPELSLWAGAKYRATQRGIIFTMTPEDLLPLPILCLVFGFALEYKSPLRFNPRSASIDRIVPDKGYTKDNVIIVSLRANVIKNTATPEEIQAVATFYAQLQAASAVPYELVNA